MIFNIIPNLIRCTYIQIVIVNIQTVACKSSATERGNEFSGCLWEKNPSRACLMSPDCPNSIFISKTIFTGSYVEPNNNIGRVVAFDYRWFRRLDVSFVELDSGCSELNNLVVFNSEKISITIQNGAWRYLAFGKENLTVHTAIIVESVDII